MRPAGAILVSRISAHSSARHAILAERYAGGHSLFRECAVAIVPIQLIGLRIVGDENVGPTVAVEVENGYAESLAGGVADAGFVGDVFEFASAEIVKQTRLVALVGFRRAVGFHHAVERALEIAFLGPLHVVGNEQVHFAVAIVVQPGGAGSEAGIPDAGRGRDIAEFPSAFVVE